MKSRDIALVAAAAVIAYLIYLYEKKKTAVASQITNFEATGTQSGTPISAAPNAVDNILSGSSIVTEPALPTSLETINQSGQISWQPSGQIPLSDLYYSPLPTSLSPQ